MGNKGSPGSSPRGAGMISDVKVEAGEKRKSEEYAERQGKKPK